MIIRNIFDVKHKDMQVHDGKAIISVARPFVGSDFAGPWHFVDYAVLPPGSSIGLHCHGDDEELYWT